MKHTSLENFNIKDISLIMSACATVAYSYALNVDVPNYSGRLLLHNEIIEGVASSPYSFRVLVPYTVELVIGFLSNIFSQETSFLLGYIFYDFVAISFSLIMLYASTRLWFSREQALAGVLFVAVTIRIGLQDHYFQPWSLLEPGFFSLALILIYVQKDYLLILLVAISTLNRETSLFIPIMYLSSMNIIKIIRGQTPINFHKCRIFFCLLATWLFVFLSLRYFINAEEHVASLQGLFYSNTQPKMLLRAVLNLILFFGAFWAFVILGARRSPELIRNIALIIPLYLSVIAIWGVWHEVRLLFPLYPILLPMGLAFIYPPQKNT